MGRLHARRWLSWSVVALVLLLSGCPYASDLPLSDPTTASLDRGLLGAWKTQDEETGAWHTITFLPFNDREMVAFTAGQAGEDAEAYRIFVTGIGSERFLNLRQLSAAEDQQWYFARYAIDGDRMALRLVDDTLFGTALFETSAGLQDFVRQRLADPRLYGADETERQDMVWYRSN